MKKFYYLIVFFIVLVGCQNNTFSSTETKELVDITFVDESSEIIQVMEDVEVGSKIALPEYTLEDYIFVGWQQTEEIYYKEYVVEASATLSVVLEDPTLVFDYSFDNEMLNTFIFSYTGQAKYLTIPTYIEGIPVTSLVYNAFRELELVEVYIPNTVQSIGQLAFSYMPNLEKISFYGNYGGYAKEIINHDKYQQILSDNSDVCNLTEGTLTKGKFEKGCPIAETLNSSEPITINNQVYITYTVIFDLEFFEEFEYNLQLQHLSLFNLPKLKTIELNSRIQHFGPVFFEELPSLQTIIVDDNPYYEVVDGVLFTESLDTLVYYPANKKDSIYDVPETTKFIHFLAFRENQNLEIINIPSSVEKIESDAFYKMDKIEEINVARDENTYFSVNGIVFEASVFGLGLFYFPANNPSVSYTVPEDVHYIGVSAFNNSKNLEELILNNGLYSIGSLAFSYSKKLSIMSIPVSVEWISNGVFYRSSIETMIINRSYYVHGSITNIRSLTVTTETPQIYVPDDSLAIYKEDEFYSYIEQFIKPLSEYQS